jgi:UDP-N-acetylmuramoyl-tripeptide--D-alanyl-D-alanine ligase
MSLSDFLKAVKKSLYFFVAAYFGMWANIVLLRWKPTIVTIIGSSGKTTLLHLLEAQIGDVALYSHRANSAFGIPFHILGLQRKTFSLLEWPVLILCAPFKIFRTLPVQKLYVTEADAERPGEGKFLAELLRPHVLIWLSLGETHGVNFDRIMPQSGAKNIEQVIAREFAHFLLHTQSLAILNKDNVFIAEQTVPAAARKMKQGIVWLSQSDLQYISVEKDRVVFRTLRDEFTVPKLVPKDVGLSVLATVQAAKFLAQEYSAVPDIASISVDKNFSAFTLPPGRSSVFVGRKNTTLIDSTYNATIDGMRTMLELFAAYPVAGPEQNTGDNSGVGEKWLVLGDMIEQGNSEESEHVLLASLIQKVNPDRVILVGPRLAQYTLPKLAAGAISVMKPGKALEYLEKNLRGGETILFKGARFLEGVVERMLENPTDEIYLCRREPVWVARRKQWGI